MLIVLDTNVLVAEKTNSPLFGMLRDYVARTKSVVVMPRLVYEEAAATYARNLQERINAVTKAQAELQKVLLAATFERIDVSVEEHTVAFKGRLLSTLGISEKDVRPYNHAHLEGAIERAIQRRPPCTNRGEEIRDAILWLIVLECAKLGSSGTPTAFVSENTKHFAGSDKVALHDALAKERGNAPLLYFPSLDAFMRQHASKITFITREWLLARIEARAVLESASRLIEATADITVESTTEQLVAPIRLKRGTTFDLGDFYVYEMRNGTHEVEMQFKGRVEVEYEARQRRIYTEWEMQFDPSTGDQPEPVPRVEIESSSSTAYPEVTASVHATVKDKNVSGWEVHVVGVDIAQLPDAPPSP